jgi:hypothetical protein
LGGGGGGILVIPFSEVLDPRGEVGSPSDPGGVCPIPVGTFTCAVEVSRGDVGVTTEPEGDSSILPGFRESELGESSIGAVLDSLVPSYKEALSPIPIPTFQGRNEFQDWTLLEI